MPTIDALIGRILDRSPDEASGRRRVALLVSAGATVTRDLELTAALQHVVEVARELVGARYGALGVIAPSGHHERFLHSGMEPSLATRIGALPTGEGILGAVITEARTIRLDRLSSDHRSVGFPAGHPPMGSFLGVPIRIDGVVFGNLYLTERDDGHPFDDLDESIITTLASMAATAIANSRLYEQSQTERRWLEASEHLNRRLLAGLVAPEALDEVVATARAVAGARAAVLGIRAGETIELAESAEEAHDEREPAGPATSASTGDRTTQGATSALAALRTAVRDRLEGPAEEEAQPPTSSSPVLVLPLIGAEDREVGALALARGPDEHPFDEADREAAARFARSVAIARELAITRSDEERLALADERERIARDLHDHVIQSLFAVGLTLQSVVGDPSTKIGAKIADQVEAIDATIRQIRQAIYRLSAPPSAETHSLRARVETLVRQALEGERLDSRLEFSGPVDTLVDTALGDEVTAVLREALSNVVRHAHASAVAVSVAVRGALVELVVTDDGRGIPAGGRRSGLDNLRARAVELGGVFAIEQAEPRGSRLRWAVPWSAS